MTPREIRLFDHIVVFFRQTAKDEKAMWKAENEEEFNYFKDLLKEELPKLFALEREFIQPLFQSFYYMQLNIFHTVQERMQQVDIGYIDLAQLGLGAARVGRKGVGLGDRMFGLGA